MLRLKRKSKPPPHLPEGFTEEPAGWRDSKGLSPIDVLDGYLRDRAAIEQWATSEAKKTSTHGRGGQMTAADEEIHNRISSRIRELGGRYFTPAARQRSSPSFGDPSEYDPSRNHVVGIVRQRAARVEVTIEYRMPFGMGSETIRYDFVKTDRDWRLDNRLALRPGERTIGGLL